MRERNLDEEKNILKCLLANGYYIHTSKHMLVPGSKFFDNAEDEVHNFFHEGNKWIVNTETKNVIVFWDES